MGGFIRNHARGDARERTGAIVAEQKIIPIAVADSYEQVHVTAWRKLPMH